MKRMWIKAFLVLICWFVPTVSAWGHKVTVFAWVEGDTVFTESKFSGGKMVKGGKIMVLDADGTQLLEGTTDDEGAFSFKAPKIEDLTIVMEAGTGHRNTWTVTAAELGGEDIDSEREAPAAPEPAVKTAGSGADAAPAVSGLSAREVEEIVARQLEEKLHPLNRMLAESRDEGPDISDILGGLGYIIGLVGLGAYVRFRRERGGS